MRRRTRLRKQGLPADPPKRPHRAEVPSLLDLSAQLAQVLTTQSLMHPTRIRALTTDLTVLRDAQVHGVEATANMLMRYGITPSELRERLL